MQPVKFLKVSTFLGALLCIAFFICLFFSIRCDPDDMLISLEESGSSFWKVFFYKYSFYSFRPVYTLISYFTIGYSANTDLYKYTVFAFYVLLYMFFVFSVYRLLKEIFSLTFYSGKNTVLTVSFSVLLVTGIYFFTTEKIELFGWLSASAIHLVPVVFVFYAAGIILKKQSKKSDYFFLFLSTLIVAGGAQHIPASVLASAAAVALVLFFEKRSHKEFYRKNKTAILKAVFFVCSLTLFFILFTTNPGVWVHYASVKNDLIKIQNHESFFDVMRMFCKPAKLIGLVLLATTLTFFLGENKFIASHKIKLKYFLSVFVACILLAVTAGSMAYNSQLVERVWFVVDVSFFILLSAVVIKYNPLQNGKIKFAFGGLSLFLLLQFDVRHIPALIKFSSEHDKIISELKQQDSGKVITLNYFPLPDLTNQVALSSDPDNAENQLFCKFYGIKAKVSLRK